ncbi:MAG: serine--tRNA ligase [Enterobacteriaceae bacterium]
MINIKFLKSNIKLISKKLNKRNFLLDIKKFREIEKKNRKLQIKLEKLQSIRNIKSKLFLKKKEIKEDLTFLKKKVVKINKIIKIIKKKLNLEKKKLKKYLFSLPNIPDDNVPIGNSRKDNVEIYKFKVKKKNCSKLNHMDICKNTGDLRIDDAIKISGKNFLVMKGNLAKLQRSLIQFMLDIHTEKHGYKEYYLPYIVKKKSLYGTGQLPNFNNNLFSITDKRNNDLNHYLIPTAEVPLVNLMRDIIIEEKLLPIKMVAHSPCFRYESKNYGKKNSGLIRTNQFEKVEIVQIVHPEKSMKALEEITKHAENILKLLKLPYRKTLLCTGEMSFSSCKTYDLEVWLPASNMYCEVSSCSNTSDFQTRRILAKFKNSKNKKSEFLHAVNGSGLAISRVIIAILENYQTKNKIKVPSVLLPYMKSNKINI